MNTDFYRERRRIFRTKDKQAIRDTLAHCDIENFDEEYEPHNEVFKDEWTEPTDGSCVCTAKRIEKECNGGMRGVYTTKDGKIKR